jgi:hypothetical protein
MKARLGELSCRLAFALAGLCGALASCGGHATVAITVNPDGGVPHGDASLPPQDAGGDAMRSPDGGCGSGLLSCAGACIDPSTDNGNCGVCHNLCGLGLICEEGVCGCPPGLTFCGGTCVDARTDANNCGACGTMCPSGVPCGGGVCGCGAPTKLCGTACVDESSDDQHCGSCINACAIGQSCTNGMCGCSGGACACAVGETQCGGATGCVNLGNDPNHCGTLCPGSICVAPLTCQDATCGCPVATQAYCRSSNTCSDLETDPANCGVCGTSCNGGTCSSGTCVTTSSCTLANNAACTPGEASPCCATPTPGISCATVETAFGTYDTSSTFANLCCIAAGQACDTLENGTCCGYMVCNGTTCACQPAGHHCANNADCCTGTCTTAHICDQTCVLSAVSCELGDTCCNAGTTNPGEACPTTSVCPS